MGLPKRIPRSRGATAKPVSDTPDDEKRVIVNRYRVEKKLGSGNFGTAFLVTDLKAGENDEELKVLKEIPCGDLQPDETIDAMHEAKLLSKLHHTGIVKFHDSFLDGEFFCIVTEFCEGGDMDEYITRMKKRGQSIPEKQIMDWTVQLLLAVHYMHSRRVLHRDLKARNIFLKNNAIKIGDFGISRILMGSADMASTFTGTPYYMSPEVLKHEGYNAKSDVWSIGCIMYELCCHKHAFEGQGLMGVMYKIVEGDCPKLPDKYSKNLQELLKVIFTKDPNIRPAASEVLQRDFVARWLEKMKTQSENDSSNAETDAKALELTLAKKHYRQDLQRVQETEDDKYKGLSPREKMRLRKQEEADKKAKELAEASRENLAANRMRHETITLNKRQVEAAPWHSGPRREMTFYQEDPGTIIEPKTLRPKTAPVHIDEEQEDEEELTLKPTNHMMRSLPTNQSGNHMMRTIPSRGYGDALNIPMNSNHLPVMNRTVGSDDRPITPMKNKMVYNVRHSTLDFKDGMPENDEELANTYYSQFEDEFAEEGGGDSPHKTRKRQLTVTHQKPQVTHSQEYHSEDDGEGTIIGAVGGTITVHHADHHAMVANMEKQLSMDDYEEHDEEEPGFGDNTLNLADDTVAGAFGPGARSIKIKNLRLNCEHKLGKDNFGRAYAYLKKARFGDDSALDTIDENKIVTDLQRIVPNHVRDCFLVEQLLFLEMQANMRAGP